jgi:hypothetical protein
MAVVKIKFLPVEMMMGMYRPEQKQYAQDALAAGLYKEESELFTVNGDSKDAAEEVFDLTNNPGRCDERYEKYGNGRSLSVGDVVVVGEEQWLCCSFGWAEL